MVSDGVYVYSAGGNNGSVTTNNLYRYDPVANSWTSLASLPTAVEEALAVYAEGKIFLFGGMNASVVNNLLQIYTIATDTWSTGAPMPDVRQQMGGGYINGIIYVAGGYSSTVLSDTTVKIQTWAYTINTNMWETKTNLPAALGGPGSAVLNGQLYILGGRNYSTSALDTVYRYNPAVNAWASGISMPAPVNTPGTAVYANHIWIFGGGNPFKGGAEPDSVEPKAYNTTFIYNAITSSWSTGPNLNVGRSFQGGAVVRNQIVSIGGYGSGASNVVEVATQNPLNILIIYADIVPPTTLQFQLLSQPGVGRVDLYKASSSTPASSWIFYDYDVVVPFSNAGWADAATLGNYLAEYLFSGGGVVVGFNFDWSSAAYALAGNWQSGGYSPFNADGISLFVDGTLGATLPGHPLLAGVTALNAFYRQTLTPAAGASTIAAWNDAKPLIARKGNAIGVSAYIGEYPAVSWSGDFARLIVNAGYWLRQDNGSCTNLVCTNPTVIQGAITDTDATQTDRILRDDPGSTCAVGSTCSTYTGGTIHYDPYYFVNNSSSEQCVTVTLDPKTCVTGSLYLQSAAYTTFDPVNLCTNFLGDIGGSPTNTTGPKSYSFKVPAWERYTVTVNETNPGAYCPDYSLQVSAGDCPIKKINLPVITR